MKIGVDAKWFFNGPPSGRVVVQNLIKNIIELNTEHELYIFLDKNEINEAFPYKNPKVHLKYIWGRNNLLSNVLVIPFVTYSLDLDIFIFQNFPPFISNFKRYSFVHDVIFKSHPEYYTFIERLYFLPLRSLVKFSHGICTVSEAERQRMSNYNYASTDAIDVVYHGVDVKFKPVEQQDAVVLKNVRQRYALPEKYLLYVGRLNVRKNIFNLLRAYALVRHDIPLVIVGGYDWKMSSVDCLINQLGIKEKLVFTGPVYGDDLAAIYGMATLFCFPSYEESFGLPALEGMAAGVPVVVSDRSSLPEICADAGNYVNPDSPENIAAVINRLLDDPHLRELKSVAGLSRAEKFKWEYSARDLMMYALRTIKGGSS